MKKIMILFLFCTRMIFAQTSVQDLMKAGKEASDKSNNKEALVFFKKALEIEPNHIEALLRKGECEAALNNPDEALKNFNACLRLDSTHNKALYNIGVIYTDHLNKHEDALVFFNKNLKFTPEGADRYFPYYGLGKAYLGLQKFKESVENYNKCIDANPKSSSAYSNRGMGKSGLRQCN
ncbi:MAG: tetratricopeptide repeat protein [Bacteroidia bacterium]|nr:tetratricopeptide repeat protein [Bacteroidia bacterium]